MQVPTYPNHLSGLGLLTFPEVQMEFGTPHANATQYNFGKLMFSSIAFRNKTIYFFQPDYVKSEVVR